MRVKTKIDANNDALKWFNENIKLDNINIYKISDISKEIKKELKKFFWTDLDFSIKYKDSWFYWKIEIIINNSAEKFYHKDYIEAYKLKWAEKDKKLYELRYLQKIDEFTYDWYLLYRKIELISNKFNHIKNDSQTDYYDFLYNTVISIDTSYLEK